MTLKAITLLFSVFQSGEKRRCAVVNAVVLRSDWRIRIHRIGKRSTLAVGLDSNQAAFPFPRRAPLQLSLFKLPSQPTFSSLPWTYPPTTMTLLRPGSLWGLVLLAGLALAHGGHEAVPEGEAISLEPIVRG